MINSTAPTNLEGIESNLSSGMVKGIAQVYAKRLVAFKRPEKITGYGGEQQRDLKPIFGLLARLTS
jgi:hypothetical protein